VVPDDLSHRPDQVLGFGTNPVDVERAGASVGGDRGVAALVVDPAVEAKGEAVHRPVGRDVDERGDRAGVEPA